MLWWMLWLMLLQFEVELEFFLWTSGCPIPRISIVMKQGFQKIERNLSDPGRQRIYIPDAWEDRVTHSLQ